MSIEIRKQGEKLIKNKIARILEQSEKAYNFAVIEEKKKLHKFLNIAKDAKEIIELQERVNTKKTALAKKLETTNIWDSYIQDLVTATFNSYTTGGGIFDSVIKNIKLPTPLAEKERLTELQETLIAELWTGSMPTDIKKLLDRIK